MATGVTITREQLEAWGGRPLTDADIDRIEACISHSSIPDAINTIVNEALYPPSARYEWRPENPAGHQPFCVRPGNHNPITTYCAADPSEPDTLQGGPSKAWLEDRKA